LNTGDVLLEETANADDEGVARGGDDKRDDDDDVEDDVEDEDEDDEDEDDVDVFAVALCT
jgi:hypothetical protein